MTQMRSQFGFQQGTPNPAPRIGGPPQRLALTAAPANQTAQVNLTDVEVSSSQDQLHWLTPEVVAQTMVDPTVAQYFTSTYTPKSMEKPQQMWSRMIGCFGCGQNHKLYQCPEKGLYNMTFHDCGY